MKHAHGILSAGHRFLWNGAVAVFTALAIGAFVIGGSRTVAEEADSRPRRLLLIGQSPDSHPFGTHEYLAGMRLVASLLQREANIHCVVVNGDEPWKEGPEVLDGADGVLLFVSEGALWLRRDPARLEAFRRLAKRGGGLAVLHWGMGTRDAENIADFVALFGGCHGGPDRKYQVVTTKVDLVAPKHPVLSGLAPFEVEEEFYYALKFPAAKEKVTLSDENVQPLLRARIDGASHTVCWAWERADGGRSFGFTGGHFHRNWERPEYRRLMAQGVLWTLKQSIPADGLKVDVAEEALKLAPRGEKK